VSAVVNVELPEVAYQYGGSNEAPVFASTVCEVMASVGKRGVNVWLAEMGAEHDLNLDATEARSLAAALLAAADASEATT